MNRRRMKQKLRKQQRQLLESLHVQRLQEKGTHTEEWHRQHAEHARLAREAASSIVLRVGKAYKKAAVGPAERRSTPSTAIAGRSHRTAWTAKRK